MTRFGGRFLKDPFKVETPSGTINGSNTVFYLSVEPSELDSVIIFLDGIMLVRGVHYTLGGTDNKEITLTDPPQPGQDIIAQYVEEN